MIETRRLILGSLSLLSASALIYGLSFLSFFEPKTAVKSPASELKGVNESKPGNRPFVSRSSTQTVLKEAIPSRSGNAQSIVPAQPAASDMRFRLASTQADLERTKVVTLAVRAAYQGANANYKMANAQLAKLRMKLAAARISYDHLKTLNADDHNVSEHDVKLAEENCKAILFDIQIARSQIQIAKADRLAAHAKQLLNQVDIKLAQDTLKMLKEESGQHYRPDFTHEKGNG